MYQVRYMYQWIQSIFILLDTTVNVVSKNIKFVVQFQESSFQYRIFSCNTRRAITTFSSHYGVNND